MWNTFHKPEQVAQAFQKSFDDLNVTYIDLYLLHSPEAYKQVHKDKSGRAPQSISDVDLFPTDAHGQVIRDNIDFVETYRAIETLLQTGYVRSIGVSNFDIPQLERLLTETSIRPVTNQVECHPNHDQIPLIQYCAERGITVTAYSPLGSPYKGKNNIALKDPRVQAIADRYHKTPAQVVLRYSVSMLDHCGAHWQ